MHSFLESRNRSLAYDIIVKQAVYFFPPLNIIFHCLFFFYFEIGVYLNSKRRTLNICLNMNFNNTYNALAAIIDFR